MVVTTSVKRKVRQYIPGFCAYVQFLTKDMSLRCLILAFTGKRVVFINGFP